MFSCRAGSQGFLRVTPECLLLNHMKRMSVWEVETKTHPMLSLCDPTLASCVYHWNGSLLHVLFGTVSMITACLGSSSVSVEQEVDAWDGLPFSLPTQSEIIESCMFFPSRWMRQLVNLRGLQCRWALFCHQQTLDHIINVFSDLRYGHSQFVMKDLAGSHSHSHVKSCRCTSTGHSVSILCVSVIYHHFILAVFAAGGGGWYSAFTVHVVQTNAAALAMRKRTQEVGQ